MTISASFEIPRPASEDHLVRQHIQQLHVLQARLANTQSGIATLTDERTALQQAAHQRSVDKLLGHAIGEEQSGRRLEEITNQLAEATAAALALSDAVPRQMAIVAGLREDAQRRVDAEVRTAAREVVAEMSSRCPALLELSSRLERLSNLSPSLRLELPPAAFLRQWVDRVCALEAAGYR